MNDTSPADSITSKGLARWLWLALQIAVLALPVVVLYRAVKKLRFNTLFLDDWVYVPLYEKAVKGGLTFQELWAGYLEHRIPIPKVLAILGVIFTKGDVTSQNWIALFLLVGSWLGVGWLLWRALGSWERMWLPWALCGGALCSAVHWQTLLMPSMHLLALPGFFLVGGLVCLGSPRLGFWPKLVLAFLAASCGMLSCASGLMLAALLPLAALAGYGMPDRRSAIRFFSILTASMFVMVGLYLYDLKSEVEPAFAYGQDQNADTLTHDVSTLLFSDPGRIGPFSLALLATNLVRGLNADRKDAAVLVGGIIFAVFLALMFWVWRGRRDGLLARAAPFLALGGYGVGSAILVTLGRAWASNSVGGALNNRYSSIAAMLEVALIALGAMLWFAERDKPAASRLRMPLSMLAGALAILLLVNACHGFQMMKAWQAARLRGAVDIHFSKTLGLSGLLGRDGPRLQIQLSSDRAKTLDELGFLVRPLAKDLRLSQFKVATDMPRPLGDIEVAAKGKDKIRIHGYTLLTSSGRPADGVLVTLKSADDARAEPMIIDIGYTDDMPAWLDTNFNKDYHHILRSHDRPQRFGRWSVDLDRTKLPPGRHHVE